MQAASTASTPLVLSGAYYAVLGYRLVRTEYADHPVGMWHYPDTAGTFLELHQALVRDVKDGVKARFHWSADDNLVDDDILLPHLSELQQDAAKDDAGKSAEEDAKDHRWLRSYELWGDNGFRPWDSRGGADLLVSDEAFRLAQPPRLFVFKTGIAFVVLRFDTCDEPYEMLVAKLRALRKPRVAGKAKGDIAVSEGSEWRRFSSASRFLRTGEQRPASDGGLLAPSLWDAVRAAFLEPFLDGNDWTVVNPWEGARGKRQATSRDHRRSAPTVVGLFQASRDLSPLESECLRELPRKLDLEPAEDLGGYRPSLRERVILGNGTVYWLRMDAIPDAGRFERRQIFLALLADHQAQQLIRICAACSEVDAVPGSLGDSRAKERSDTAIELRKAIVNYSSRYHFVRVSVETRLERFYQEFSAHLAIERLRAEAEGEVSAVHELARAEAERRRTIATGLLAFVFSPLGVVIGIYQEKVLPTAWFTRFVPAAIAPLVPLAMATLTLGVFIAIASKLVPEDIRFTREHLRPRKPRR